MLSKKQKKHFLVSTPDFDYYSVQGLEKLKNEMLRLLAIIDNVARDNNIKYWIDGGSLIGVIRHNGMIPWDDDLDISMLKDDYLLLIEKLSEYCEEHHDAYLFYKSPQNYHVCNYFASRNVFFRTEGSTLLIPIKVDIRPVNCVSKDVDSINQNKVFRDIANFLIFKKKYGYARNIPNSSSEINRFFYKYNNCYGLMSNVKHDFFLVHPYFEFSSQFDLNYDDIFPLKKHKFENLEVTIPNHTDYLLRQLYGDYLNLPSLEHRAPVACQVFEKSLSYSFYSYYIKKMFGYKKITLFGRLVNMLLYIRLLGLIQFFKIKFYE